MSSKKSLNREQKRRNVSLVKEIRKMNIDADGFREIIDALPMTIYTTDAEGRLTHFNKAAVEFSGRIPELGTDRWCVTWKLFYPDRINAF